MGITFKWYFNALNYQIQKVNISTWDKTNLVQYPHLPFQDIFLHIQVTDQTNTLLKNETVKFL